MTNCACYNTILYFKIAKMFSVSEQFNAPKYYNTLFLRTVLLRLYMFNNLYSLLYIYINVPKNNLNLSK